MKNLSNVPNAERFAGRLAKTALALFVTGMLGVTWWVAPVSIAQTEEMLPVQMIQAEMPQGTMMQTAGKTDFINATVAAAQKHPNAIAQIARAAGDAHPEWRKDILRALFRGLGVDDCRLLERVRRALATGPDANELTELALTLAPGCAAAFGGAPGGERPGGGGAFGAPPANLNPPPGSIGGGGGQGNVVAICHNNMTIFVSPQGAEAHLRQHAGDYLGACVVTPVQNP